MTVPSPAHELHARLPGREHPELRADVRAWVDATLPGGVDTTVFDPYGYHRHDVDHDAWATALADAGWAAPVWPVAFGGGGRSRSEAIAIHEELVASGAPAHLDTIGLGMIGPTLLECASPEQQQRWLPAIVDGTQRWCQLFSEPGSGSDLASLTSTARRVDAGYVVRGQKVWTSNADNARWGLLVVAVDDADAAAPDAGIRSGARSGYVALAVDLASDGVEIRPILQPHGDATFCEVFLDDVVVADTDRIGGPSDGWRIAIATLLYERAALGGFLFDLTGPMLRLGTDLVGCAERLSPATRAAALAVFADAVVHRLHVRRLALADGGDGVPGGTDWFVAKVVMARLNQRLTDMIWRLQGTAAAGGVDDPAVQAMLRSRANTIEGGSGEILLSNIGERLLGLPREPRPAA